MRDSFRFWRRRPLSLAAVIVSIGLGTAVAVTTVATVRAVFWRTLAGAEPYELVSISERRPAATDAWGSIHSLAFLFWREQQDVFDDVAAYGVDTGGLWKDLLLEGGAEEVRELRVTGSFFDVLGLTASAGRMFTDADVETGHPLGVLSHSAWTRLFERDPDVIGRAVSLDHPWSSAGDGPTAVTIVGVVTAGFDADWSLDGTPVDIFTLLQNPAEYPTVRVIGRLRAGVTQELAEARMNDVVARSLREVYPPSLFSDETRPIGARVASLHEDLYGTARPLVRLLLAAGALLVVIGCASAAATLVTMASRRSRDVAIQQALGRPVGDLRRGMVVEGLCLGLLAGVSSLAAARVMVGAVVVLGPASLPRITAAELGWFEAGLAGLLAAVSGMAAALLPAAIVRPDAFDAMRAGGTATSAMPTLRWRQGLLAIQVALVLALLVTAGLMLGTLRTLVTRPLGFSMDGVLAAEFRVPNDVRTDQGRTRVFVERVLDAVRTVSGSDTFALASDTPLGAELRLFAYPTDAGPRSLVNVHRVGPGYFDQLGIPMLAGRDLATYEGASNAVVVNAAFAREHYGNPAAALGRWLRWGARDWPAAQIIGVVGDTRQRGLRHDMPPVLYVPLIAHPVAGVPLHGTLHVLVRMQGDPARAAADLRTALQTVDSRRGVRVSPLADRYREEIAAERLLASALAALGGSTLLLSVFGIVALVGQLVSDRSRELALHLVLGSSRAAILGLVMRGVLVPALAGTLVGLVLASWGVGLIRQFLFETPPYDPTLWGLAVGTLVAAALAGAWWPARRALRIDPARVLRWE